MNTDGWFNYIERADLEVGAIYRLKARNLICGVWDGRVFIGIREKFDNRYLDTCEVPFETAFPLVRLGAVPEGIEVKAREPYGDGVITYQKLFDYLEPIDDNEVDRWGEDFDRWVKGEVW